MKKLAAVFRLLLFSGYHIDFVSHSIGYLSLHRFPRTPFSVSELAAFSSPDTLAVRPRRLISVSTGRSYTSIVLWRLLTRARERRPPIRRLEALVTENE